MPIRAAFYYPWYPGHWNEDSVHAPILGRYGSTESTTVDWHIRFAHYAGLDAFITSWWGPNDDFGTDAALPVLLQHTVDSAHYPELRWCIYYELESVSDPSPQRIVEHLRYLETRAFNSPAYLRVDGKPVVFVYAAPFNSPHVASRWRTARRRYGKPIYLVLQVYEGWQSDPNQPDAWHQYATADNGEYLNGAAWPHSMTVSPGFQKPGKTPLLHRDPDQFEKAVATMVAQELPWQLVTTWNEWGEGSAVEPASEFDPPQRYLDILHSHFVAAAARQPVASEE